VKFIKELKNKLLKKYRSGELIKKYYKNELNLIFLRKKPNEKEFLNEYKTYDYGDKYALFEEVNYKGIGTQKVLRGARFESFYDLLEFIGKRKEFLKFEKLLFKDNDLIDYLKENPKILLDNTDIWEKVLEVKNFFKQNPGPGIYIRELPVRGVDSKFIQNHKKVIDKILMQVCEYDKNVKTLSNYGFERKYFLKYPKPRIRIKNKEWDDIEINVEDLKKFKEKKLFIIENLQTYLAFPVIEGYMTVFGGGFKAGVLKGLDYEAIYWGDIDTAGFAILSMVRSFIKTESFLMDLNTFKNFEDLAVDDIKKEYGRLNLTAEEFKCYNFIKAENKRLEQERIPFWYVKEKLGTDLIVSAG